MTTQTNVIQAEGLVKSFGDVRALAGVDLDVRAGSVCAVLGRNGAGKTTAVRILTTLLAPDAGRAEVAGFDVRHEPGRVRARIGVTGQSATMDELLTGRQNLDVIGRLYHLPPGRNRERADELLEQFDLAGAAARLVSTYSGGMRRRLDLAASLITAPPVLFLDEPTTGLDPVARAEMWESIRSMSEAGTTVLMTTQYLDDAEQLADSVAVIDGGAVVARGTPSELKAGIGRPRVRITLPDAAPDAVAAAGDALGGGAEVRGRSLSLAAPGGLSDLAAVVDRLRDAGVAVADVGLEQPTLDEAFAALTGASEPRAASAEPPGAAGDPPAAAAPDPSTATEEPVTVP